MRLLNTERSILVDLMARAWRMRGSQSDGRHGGDGEGCGGTLELRLRSGDSFSM